MLPAPLATSSIITLSKSCINFTVTIRFHINIFTTSASVMRCAAKFLYIYYTCPDVSDARLFNRNRNRKLLISRAPKKAKSQEPAYSQALNQNKIDRQLSRSRESVRQTVRRLW